MISMVVDGEQVREVLLGEQGVARGAAPGTLCIDMSTIAPAQTRAIGAELDELGLALLDAPVTGSSPKAQDGTLTIMAGGSAGDFARAEPLFGVMGDLVVHVGPLGHGETVKLINNAVAAANCATVAEALLVGQATGVDLDALVQVMGKGSGGSAMLDLKAGADARPRLRHALQARAHAQGRAALPGGGAVCERALRGRRPRARRARRGDGAWPRERRLRRAAGGPRSVRRKAARALTITM